MTEGSSQPSDNTNSVVERAEVEGVSQVTDISHPQSVEVVIEENVIISVGEFVVARYDSKCYIGEVCEVSTDDDTVQVNFMTKYQKVKANFKWPSQEDKIWIDCITL